MNTPSQGLRALASLMEAVVPQFSDAAQTMLSGITAQLHTAADAEAADEAARLAGPTYGPLLSTFASAMIDGFFSAAHLTSPAKPATAPVG